MCGLAGVFGSLGVERTRERVEQMLQVQTHRGPDSAGTWCGTVQGVDIGLGLRRLKILDLSDAANQPMLSEDGRYVLVYNGEIYNYIELRAELAASGARFRTQGDTEVLLHALIVWGTAAFTRFNGMWGLALLDRDTGEVLLSRDRFGIKPLYTYSDDKGLFVASEIKAILEVVNHKFKVTPSTANAYLCQALLCTSSATFFRGIEEFPAGHLARFHLEDIGNKRLSPQRYWTVPTTLAIDLSENALIESVRSTFIDSVKLRLRSDVRVGVLLSGGTDSSAIAAAVYHLAPPRSDIMLISAVGSNGAGDEQPFIDMMAKHLERGAEKVAVDYAPARTFDLISEVCWFNDEPIGSFSTVAHYLLMKRARDLGVVVLLSGQGGDESLCGYNKYVGFFLQELMTSGRWLAAARVCGTFLGKRTVFPQITYGEAKRYLPRWLRLAEIDVRGPALLEDSESVCIGLTEDGVVGRQVADLERFSVPPLVHYEDRMSMAASREIRLPFLDYRLVSLFVPLPVEFKLRGGWTKWIFRRAMEPLLPKEIAWRKDKQGFIVPQYEWFRRELREEVAKLLESEWVSERLGLIDRQKFRARYDAYLRQPATGGRYGIKDIFAPVALELWARCFERYLSL
ncbi:MAG: asparagine synthase (glutamine-hydrolyzing) [Nitrospiria bacterium]